MSLRTTQYNYNIADTNLNLLQIRGSVTLATIHNLDKFAILLKLRLNQFLNTFTIRNHTNAILS